MSVATRDMQVNSLQESSKAVLIAGPTASGKSALALELAQKTGGVVINADSMQVYRDLRVITARPTPEEEATVPHRLYGHVDAAVNFSAGHWVADAATALAEVRAQNRLPIFVGGSGLYFKALTRGLSAVPPISPAIREGVRSRLERDGAEALHAELAQRDRATAERLKPRDRTRIARACRRCCHRERAARCFWRPIAISSTRASMRALMRCSKPARWRKSPRFRRGISIRCCRP